MSTTSRLRQRLAAGHALSRSRHRRARSRFEKYWIKLSCVERLATGCRWAEGPVYVGDGRYLLWSDIPNNRILKWEEETGAVSVYRKPSNFANGNTRDRQGRLVTCLHGGRSVVRTEYDGSITTIADSFDGKRLNSPNDVVVKSDGSIWFTDPVFGILADYEGYKATPEIDANVYRWDPDTKQARHRRRGRARPQRPVLLARREDPLHRREPRRAEPQVPGLRRHRRRPQARQQARPDRRRPGGTPDGMRCDVDGNLWCGWGMGSPELDGVMVFAPDGKPIGRIALPERCANVCFGGLKRNRLFMAASQSVYALYINGQGAAGG